MLPSADKLYGDADFIFHQAPAHTAKRSKTWFNGRGVTVLDWPADSPDLNPCATGHCQETDDRRETEQCRRAEGRYEASWCSVTPQQCHRLMASCRAALRQ